MKDKGEIVDIFENTDKYLKMFDILTQNKYDIVNNIGHNGYNKIIIKIEEKMKKVFNN